MYIRLILYELCMSLDQSYCYHSYQVAMVTVRLIKLAS